MGKVDTKPAKAPASADAKTWLPFAPA